MMIVLGVLCFVGLLILPIAGRILLDAVSSKYGVFTEAGIYTTLCMLGLGLFCLGLRCFIGHW